MLVTAKNHTITYGEEPVGNGVTFEGFLNGEDVGVLGGTLVYDFSYEQFGNVGSSYTIAPKGYSSTNYTFNYVSAKLTVEQKEIGIAWSNTALTYNTKAQKPIAAATGLVNGDLCSITVSGEKTVVGSNYTATATVLSNANYKLPSNKTTLFSIAKAVVTVPTLSGSYTYNGKAQTVNVKGTNSLMNVSGTTKTNAGSYVVTVSLRDTANYKWNNGETKAQTLEWSIGKASLTVRASDKSITYGDAPGNNGVTYSGFATAIPASSLGGAIGIQRYNIYQHSEMSFL